MSIKYDENKAPYIDLGEYIIRLETDEPDERTKEKARIELREEPEIMKQSLEELRELVKAESALHVPTDDEFLTMFLRPCKYYPDSAFDRMMKGFRFKVKHAKLFDNLLPINVRIAFEQDLVRLLPKRDQNGTRILLLDVGKKWNPSKCTLSDLFRAIQLTIFASMKEPSTQINGGLVLFDMEGLSLKHVMQFTPSFAAMVLEWVQETLSLRLKAVHIVNNSYIFNMLFAIFKPFIGEKLRKRIHFHGKDMKSLTTLIDEDCLPEKYGGTMNIPDYNGAVLADLFQLYTKDFERASTYVYTKD